ncbi:hypothetical protein BF95_24265 [Sphingobium sp. Ant17]|nr:hypothetical protein BF95_24265 [Sphingobium sp. Ant17]
MLEESQPHNPAGCLEICRGSCEILRCISSTGWIYGPEAAIQIDEWIGICRCEHTLDTGQHYRVGADCMVFNQLTEQRSLRPLQIGQPIDFIKSPGFMIETVGPRGATAVHRKYLLFCAEYIDAESSSSQQRPMDTGLLTNAH